MRCSPLSGAQPVHVRLAGRSAICYVLARAPKLPALPLLSTAVPARPRGTAQSPGSVAQESGVREVGAAGCRHGRCHQGTGAGGRDPSPQLQSRRGRKSKAFVAPREPNAAYSTPSATGSEPSCPRYQRHKHKTLLGLLLRILTTDRIFAPLPRLATPTFFGNLNKQQDR